MVIEVIAPASVSWLWALAGEPLREKLERMVLAVGARLARGLGGAQHL